MKSDLLVRMHDMLENDVRDAERNLIIQNHDGSYELYGIFSVVPGKKQVTVKQPYREEKIFHDLKAAVSWCIAEKFNLEQLAQEIAMLDLDMHRHKIDYDTLSHMAARIQDPERRFTVGIKCQESHSLLKRAQERLRYCVGRAKYFQIKGFNDEIARTRRPTPNRTSSTGARKTGRPSR